MKTDGLLLGAALLLPPTLIWFSAAIVISVADGPQWQAVPVAMPVPATILGMYLFERTELHSENWFALAMYIPFSLLLQFVVGSVAVCSFFGECL